MKKLNKAISILLVLALAFSMLTMTTNAATERISQVDLELDITDGSILGNWDEYITIKTDNVLYDDFNGNSCVDAMCTDDFVHVLPTDSFESGKTYDIRMFFTVEDGYSFDTTMIKVTINGETVDPNTYSVGYEYVNGTSEKYQYLVVCIEDFTVEEDVVELTFWQMILNFFISIFDFILGLFM